MAQPRPVTAHPRSGFGSAEGARPHPPPDPRASRTGRPDWALLPLRAFLGVTFCFAGLQKLANPNFFHAASPVSIQSQLAGAARHSPLHSLLQGMEHVAVPVGLLIAFGELAVGLGTLAGLLTRAAAAGGMLLSLGLFLTVTFHSNPYYTGSDIVFLFAWTALLLAGPGPLTADAVLARTARRPSAATRAGDLDRRAFVLRGAAAALLGALGVAAGGVTAGIGRLVGATSAGGPARSLREGAATPTTTTSTNPTPAGGGSAPTSSAPTTTAPVRPPGTRLGPASNVPVGGAASFDDPATGDPALVIQPVRGTFLAFDAVCPHAGCPVEWSSGDRKFICPCHGSEFNGRTGAVEVGPAQSGLTRIAVAEGSDGQLYAK